ncbi:hypothetical protein T492DRAFT_892991 [Pavlovales sp. CCMP2436]|nr:hypothetical protein T492DRAFT_892991 [Pavlovales sp. CCMP2436]
MRLTTALLLAQLACASTLEPVETTTLEPALASNPYSADLLVVFPGWACEARAYSGVVEAAGFGRSVLYLPLYDDDSELHTWMSARAGGGQFVAMRSSREAALVDRLIGERREQGQRLVFFGHSAGSATARQAANRWVAHMRAVVFYGGVFAGNQDVPYPFLAIEGGANLNSRDGALQVNLGPAPAPPDTLKRS